ncbi:MAG: hypothetical protein WCS09_02885 [Pseudomonadota bacterium]|jgi:hypothetical protein
MGIAVGHKTGKAASTVDDGFHVNPAPMRAISAAELPQAPTVRQLAVRVAARFECSASERDEIIQLAIADPMWASLSFRIMLGMLD